MPGEDRESGSRQATGEIGNNGRMVAGKKEPAATTDPQLIRERRCIEGGETVDTFGRTAALLRPGPKGSPGGYDADKPVKAGQKCPGTKTYK